jgi:hypothetical protein
MHSVETTDGQQRHQLNTADLRPGDILLISGAGVFSRLVGFIEGTSFDHVTIVAPPDLEHPLFGRGAADDRTDEPWMIDIGFDGGRWKPVSAYDDRVRSIAVRRHRVPGASALVPRAISIAQETKGYAWDRLLFLSLVAATRWSMHLNEMGPRMSGAFMQGLFEIMARMRIDATTEGGPRRICTELLSDTFDTCLPSTASLGSPDQYLGLVIPPTQHRGLLWWAAGVQQLADFVVDQPPTGRYSVLDTDLSLDPGQQNAAVLLQELAHAGGVSFLGVTEVDEVELRSLVIDGVTYAMDKLMVDFRVGDVDAVLDPRRAAWFLLDQLMRHRFVVTPADIGATKSLVDVGVLDHSSIPFRKSGING